MSGGLPSLSQGKETGDRVKDVQREEQKTGDDTDTAASKKGKKKLRSSEIIEGSRLCRN